MRIFTRICLLLMVIQLHVISEAEAQNRENLITVDFQDTPYFEAFKTIQQMTKINFIYNEKDLDGLQPITASFEDVPLFDVISHILYIKRGVITFEIVDNTVIIRPRPLMNISLIGTVVDKNSGEALQWATIAMKNRSLGTQTNMDGQFFFTVPNGEIKLTISFLGYKSIDVNVTELISSRNGDVFFNETNNTWFLGVFLLEPVKMVIQEVVVTGMANRSASSFTGSTQKITHQEIKSTGATNVIQSLRQLAPSLRIFENMEAGSDPNAMPDFELRGASKLVTEDINSTGLRGMYQYRPNQPLFILDGFETNIETIFNMDINRISSITILKDAAAKAIYGSKASNGVIVIESRTMAETGTLFSVNYKLVSEIPDLRSYNLANAKEKLQFELDNGVYGYSDYMTIENIESYNKIKRLVDAGLDTDWLSKPVRTGLQHYISGMVEFGDNNLRNSLNFMGNFDQGVMKGSSRDVLFADIITRYRTSNLNFRNMLRAGHTTSNDSPYGDFSIFTRMNPHSQPYDVNGDPVREITGTNGMGGAGGGPLGNPIYDATLPVRLENTSMEVSENMELEWVTPLNGFRVIGQAGITHRRYTDHRFYPGAHSRFILSESSKKGSYDYGTGELTEWKGSASMIYSKVFAKKHAFFCTGRFDVVSTDFTELLFQVEGFQSTNVASIIYGNDYKSESRPIGMNEVRRSVSVLGVLSYSYDDRYAVDASLRRDAASVFGDDNKWTTSFSGGLRWNIHNEKFLRGGFFNRLSLRTTIGQTGNQNQGSNFSVYTYSPENWYFPWMPGATVNMMENKHLLWEKKIDFNVGLEIAFHNFDLSVEYYQNYTSNMVIPITIAPSIGFGDYNQNLGEVRNNGIEAEVAYTIINRGDAHLRTHFSLATNSNRLHKLSDAMKQFNSKQEEIAAIEGNPKPTHMYVDGQDMNTIWAVKSYGIDPYMGHEIFCDRNGDLTTEWNARDLIPCGSSNVPLNGIMGISAMWKRFRFDTSMEFRTGGQIYNATLINKVEDVDPYWNVDRRAIYDKWSKPGDEARYDRIVNGARTKATSRFVQDLTVLKLNTVQLAYEFDTRVLEKLHLQRFELSLTADNLWEWWSVGFERGTSYPFSRTFRFGIGLVF